MWRHFRRSRRRLLSRRAWQLRLVFWIGAVAVGLVAAGFASLTDVIGGLFRSWEGLAGPSIYLVPPVALAAIAGLTQRYFKGSEGSGIPQVIVTIQRREQYFMRRSLLSTRVAIGKTVLTLLGLLTGASIGREGPTVHIGAVIMYRLSRFGKFPRHYLDKGLVVAGGAAGIAAAFNTPIAGVMFAVEELTRAFDERSSAIILIAILVAGTTAIAIMGNYNYFGSVIAYLPMDRSWLAVPLCGIVGGLLGGLFSQSLVWGGRRLMGALKSHPMRVGFACGLVVSLAALLSGGSTFGTGYVEAKHILLGSAEFKPFFPVLKIIASSASYLSGVPGGIFSPSLSAGAGVGADLYHWLPLAPYEAMILLGMVGYFAGVIQAPITAFVIVLEMTNNQDITFGLLAASLLGFGSSRLVCPVPVYTALAQQYLDARKRLAGTPATQARTQTQEAEQAGTGRSGP